MLFNINNSSQRYSFFCSQLNGPKYCYVSLTIQLKISHLFKHSLNVKLFYLIHRTLSGANTSDQSGPWSDGNEGVLHISQSSRAGASPSDCHIHDTCWWYLPFCRDRVGVFHSPSCCRLFNAKSIFFTNSHFYFTQFNLA